MSNHLAELARRTNLAIGPKSVLAAVCDAVNDESGIGWPSVEHMAHYCSTSVRSVQSHLAALEAAGMITREMRIGRSTIYRVNKDVFPRDAYFDRKRTPPQFSHPRNRRTPADSAPPQNAYQTPADSAPTPATVASTPATVAPRTLNNPLKNPTEPKPGLQGEKPEAENLSTERFDEFWAAWPEVDRKQDKIPCRDHWLRNDLDAKAHVIVAHVEASKRSRKWKSGYSPAPLRYLENQRWEDGAPIDAVATAAEAIDGDWFESDSGIAKRGGALSVQREKDEPTPKYLLRVAKAAGRGAHIDYVLREAKRSGSSDWYRHVVQFLGEALMPTDFYAS